MKYFGKGSKADRDVLAKVTGVTPARAMAMITSKIEERLEGGPSGLRRAFQFFDRNGSGSIDFKEFRSALATYTMLEFETPLLRKLFAKVDNDGKGTIDFEKFSAMIMGSTKDATTGLDTRTLKKHDKFKDRVSFIDGNSDVMILRKVRQHWKDLQYAFKDADVGETGSLTKAQLRFQLEKYHIDMSDGQFEKLVKKIDLDGDGEVTYRASPPHPTLERTPHP